MILFYAKMSAIMNVLDKSDVRRYNMANIAVDFSKIIGKMKPVHGIGQPPVISSNTSLFRFLTDAGIPYSRLHDVGGRFGGNCFVDVPNIFRDFDADENDPQTTISPTPTSW